MNDTETEARRLFAAATEDIPPDIDLLGGFAAARRQGRSRRTRRGAVLSAGIAAAAVAVSAIALTAGSAPPALATVTSALTRTLSQSYHLSSQESSYYLVNGQVRYPDHYVCATEADPVRQRLARSCSNGVVTREVGGYTYTRLGITDRHPNGKPWLRMRSVSIADLPKAGFMNEYILGTPQQMLAEIKEEATVTVAGPASGPGWTGTRYAFSDPKLGLSGTVTVDQQGRARALAQTIRTPNAVHPFVLTQVMTFSDFGAPVTVTPPPADQIFSVP